MLHKVGEVGPLKENLKFLSPETEQCLKIHISATSQALVAK